MERLWGNHNGKFLILKTKCKKIVIFNCYILKEITNYHYIKLRLENTSMLASNFKIKGRHRATK